MSLLPGICQTPIRLHNSPVGTRAHRVWECQDLRKRRISSQICDLFLFMINVIKSSRFRDAKKLQQEIEVHPAPLFSFSFFFFFFALKRIYLLFEILLKKKKWIRWNPRFSVPRRNLENSTKTPSEFEENGSSGYCDFYPGRLNISRPLISFRMVQYTFEKCAQTPSRSAIFCCSSIPDL